MLLSEAIRQDGRTLLAAHKTLSNSDIRSLNLRIPEATIRVIEPEFDDIVNFEDDSKDRELADSVRGRINEAIGDVPVQLMERTSLHRIDVSKLYSTVAEVVDYMQTNPTAAAMLPRAVDPDCFLAKRAGTVFYLSVLLGATMREYVIHERLKRLQAHDIGRQTLDDLTPLGLGVLFMDVGLTSHLDLFKEDRKLTPGECRQVRAHPHAGVDMLPRNFSAVAQVVVKTHHENYENAGYPENRIGYQLHVFSRIARVADAFEAATASQVFPGARSPVRVLWEMTSGPYRRFYDPAVLEVLSSLIQPFPIGSKLRLADGRYAIVVRYNRKKPLRPKLLIAYDEEGRRLPRARLIGPVDMDTQPEIQIASWGKEDLTFLNAGGGGAPRAENSSGFSTMFEALYP